MNWIIVLFAILTFIFTLLGGLMALKFKNKMCLFFAFAAGSLMGVSFFDLLPESINLAGISGIPIRYISLTIVGSFLLYSFLERVFLTHHHHDDEKHGHIMGPIGAGSLILHSFLDGAAIGSAFQVSNAVGLIVALAVISHDFTDGLNTVTLMLKNKHKNRKALGFLVGDAIAPVLGVIATSWFVISDYALAFILAFFMGEFIYLGASNLLPELREHKSFKVTFWMLLGVLVMFALSLLIA